MTMGDAPQYGVARYLESGLRSLVAPNPSAMTYWGTNTYLVGTRELAVIDPGPDDDRHLDAILDSVGAGQRITHIIVTHTHVDHSPLARRLARRTGAQILAFGDAFAGRSEVMHRLAARGMAGGGEGIDAGFEPDRAVADGEIIQADGWELEVIHTPGHLGNHIVLAWKDTCFTADHVMGWASSLVSPPDGDLTDFMASCARLGARDWRIFYPGHGNPVMDPAGRLNWLIKHRLSREAQILDVLSQGSGTSNSLTLAVYSNVSPSLLPAAERNVFAHLVNLVTRNEVVASPGLGPNATYSLPRSA